MAYKLPQQALYAFQLPPDLLAALQPRQLVIPDSHPLHPSNRLQDLVDQDPATPPPTATRTPGNNYTCALTGASFPTLDGLKHHYRTDWYRYNVKLRLEGKKTPVAEDDFNRLVDNLSASISGSDASSASTSDSDFSASDDDRATAAAESGSNLSRVLRKTHLSRAADKDGNGDDGDDDDVLAGPRTALQWFEAPTVADETQYGVARAALPLAGARKRALPGAEEGRAVLDELRALQLAPEAAPSSAAAAATAAAVGGDERKWTLLMFGGGHFAGMVVQLRPKLVSRGKGKDKEREVVVLAKKTFHRYTTRRKQGGAQSTNDSGKGKAKSAGAMIRRHNEAALTDEVRELLGSWAPEIRSSELVFLRCSKNNYRTFFGYDDDAPLQKGDARIRGFGFPTKRPTINELMRSFLELTRVKTSHLSASALAALDASYLSSIAPKPAPAPPAPASSSTKKEPAKPAEPQLTKAEELERDRWTRLVDMVRKGRVDALRAFLDKYGPELESGHEDGPAAAADSSSPSASPTARAAPAPGTTRGKLPSWWDARERERTPTLLHCAASADQAHVVRFLLESPSSPSPDPTYLSPLGRTPYELCGSRATRNQFRFVAFSDPARCDWVGAARVPSGLDERVELEKERREEERRAKARERDEVRERERVAELEAAREKEEQRVREAQARAPSLKAGVNRLGGGPPAVIQDRQRSGLSEEQKRRVEREERARAAEARLKRLGGGGA
ncbi:uncharacterized protein RHOBADRAFT_49987 [Rhodotorula graminis WP1]|uniref:VLRF1 domain-containing protein n=1 Tax=Rhodotorula graminis (strain WP1) TaxID=578459 RepID=A0A0N8Q038_RHOGW|nr:uncharacterized protein RHOBADRAFT_49987 [Rhodotorula graminis WP1]KPV74045.1 hypothetical protein RHOBADRAFT_49987 [Rhodotorula graminis WP1]